MWSHVKRWLVSILARRTFVLSSKKLRIAHSQHQSDPFCCTHTRNKNRTCSTQERQTFIRGKNVWRREFGVRRCQHGTLHTQGDGCRPLKDSSERHLCVELECAVFIDVLLEQCRKSSSAVIQCLDSKNLGEVGYSVLLNLLEVTVSSSFCCTCEKPGCARQRQRGVTGSRSLLKRKLIYEVKK